MNNMKDLIALFENHKIYDGYMDKFPYSIGVYRFVFRCVLSPKRTWNYVSGFNSNKPDSIRNIRYCLYLDCEIFYLYPLCIMYTSSTLNWEIYFSI